ncbi:MAG TPA: cyclic nucleotide-binding domain-containing protein [Methyloceanibacter sp.]|nr:cyclic nucleotide-binding domain-containing protein [Methyloceanibacter sp.]
MEQALRNAAFAEDLTAICERLETRKGEIIASQGDAADSMHFVVEGRVGIIVRLDDGRSVRVRSLGPHTTIGEMGLITRQSRSATVQAEADSVLYGLRSLSAAEGREPIATSGLAHLHNCGDGRTAERRKQSDRCVAPLEARERITQQR